MSSPKSLFGERAAKKAKIDNEEKQEPTTSQNMGRIIPSKNVRKPAFNPALLSSAFYTGPTMYGGAGACSSSSPYNQYTKSKFYDRKKTDIKVTPSTSSNSMSQTAKRISELLEQYSSPISDAKRVPILNRPSAHVQKKSLNSSIFDMSRKSCDDSLATSSNKSHRFRELQIPSMATLIKIKKNNRSSGSAHAAILASMSSSQPYKPQAYSMRSTAETGSYRNKIKSKVTSTRSSKLDEEEMAEPVNLPNISLNMTGLPTFTLEHFKPQANSTQPSGFGKSDKPSLVPGNGSAVLANFKFTCPVSINNAKGTNAASKFQFSEPLDIFSSKFKSWTNDETSTSQFSSPGTLETKTDSAIHTKSSQPDSVSKPSKFEKSGYTQPGENFKSGESNLTPKSSNKRPPELWNGNDWKPKESDKYIPNGDIIGGDAYGKKPNVSGDLSAIKGKENSEPKKVKSDVPVSGGFESFIKKQQQLWECGSCMTRNDPSETKCVCCETPKPGDKASPVANTASASFSSMTSIIKKQQELWECGSCMSRNEQSQIKCACCETPKPGEKPAHPASTIANPTYSGMANFMKKQQGQWECPCCMSRNDQNRTKCACCQASKPSNEPARVDTVTFDFGKTPNTFRFGIDKANEPITSSVESSKSSIVTVPTSGFVFGNPTTTHEPKPGNGSIGGFTFGISNGSHPKPANSDVSKQSTESDNKGKESTLPAAGGFTFGIPKTIENNISTGTTSTTDTKLTSFTFSSPQKTTETKTESNKPVVNFGSRPEDIKPTSAALTSEGASSTTTSTTSTTSTVKSPPAFTFGSPKPALGGGVPFQFGTPASSAPAPAAAATDSSFKPTGMFSFGSKNTTATTDPKPATELSKPAFQLPAPSAGPMFPSPSTTTSATDGDKPIGSGITFSGNAMPEKPKEPTTAPFFSFGSSSNAPPTENAFSKPAVFSFGSNAATKSETSTLFNPPPMNSTPNNLFGTAPESTINPPSTSIFKPAQSTTPATFSSSSNLFRPSPNVNSTLPSNNIFGSGSLNTSTSKPPVPIFGSSLSSESTAQPSQTNSLFSNPSVPSFNSGNIFGNPPQQTSGVTSQTPNLFGNPTNKPASETGGSMFMNNPQASAVSGNIFGSAMPAAAPSPSSSGIFGSSPSVPTPLFGASIPFGEPSQIQSQQNAPFKFGVSGSTQPSAVVGFGQAPAAGSSAPVFSFGSGVTAPPPSNAGFNFSMGSPAFPSAPGAMANPTQRRIKKAVRRSVQR